MITLYVLLVLAVACVFGSNDFESVCPLQACILSNHSKYSDKPAPNIQLLLLSHLSELEMLKLTPNLENLYAYDCEDDFKMEVLPPMANLKNIEIKNCSISELPNYQFQNVINLEKVKLSRDSIQRLSNETFYKLSLLRFLNLEDNLIEDLPERVFYPLENLYWVNLTNNKISILTEDLFSRNTKLRAIYLEGNPLKTINLVFSPWSMELIKLDLSNCVQLRDTRLSINVLTIDLQNSGLERLQIRGRIASKINHENSKVTHADFHGTYFQLSLIKAICDLPSLEWVDLSNISKPSDIRIFNWDEDENMCSFSSLKFLNMSYNKLRYIPQRFPLLGPNLATLDLAHNFLDEESLDYFFYYNNTYEFEANFPNLRFFNLSNNKLKNIPRRFLGPSLTTLDLSHNLLEDVSLESFAGAHSLESLYLEGNRLTSFDYLSVCSALKNLKKITLYDNLFNATFYDSMTKFFGGTDLHLIQKGN